MFKAKLKLVQISGNKEELDQTLDKLVKFNQFFPIEASTFVRSVHGLDLINKENSLIDLKAKLDYLIAASQADLNEVKSSKENYDLDDVINYYYKETQALNAKLDDVNNRIDAIEVLTSQVMKFSELDLRFDDFFRLKFVVARFGMLPIESVAKIKYYSNKPFIFIPFSQENQDMWCAYLTTNEYERVVDNIMDSLFFQRIMIPANISQTPQVELQGLSERLNNLKEQKNQLTTSLTTLYQQMIPILKACDEEIAVLTKRTKAFDYVVLINDKFLISCFIKKKMIGEFEAALSPLSLEIEIRPASSDKRLTVPRKIGRFII